MDSSVKGTISRVGILGAGWVGRQVAARMAIYGVDVWLIDRDVNISRAAISWMRTLSDSSPGWLDRVHSANSLAELAAGDNGIELILESVPEQITLKKRVLREASRLFPPPTLIASNSSYFVPSLLAGFVDQPQRFAHLHFHVPVLEDSVVDIVGGPATDPSTLTRLRQLTMQIKQEPLLLRHEHPGYVFNWLLQSLLKSALELAVLDVADPEDIDKSWKAVTGMALGPFGIMDRIGLDVIEQVLSNARWAETPQVSIEQLLKLLAEHTQRGDLGVKSKAGFYQY